MVQFLENSIFPPLLGLIRLGAELYWLLFPVFFGNFSDDFYDILEQNNNLFNQFMMKTFTQQKFCEVILHFV